MMPLSETLFFQIKKITGNRYGGILAIGCLFPLSLVLLRFCYTGEHAYFFLAWNLFLAMIPVFLSGWLVPKAIARGRVAFLTASITWLLFLPNSFYILTDLFHLEEQQGAPRWFDLAVILSFAWSGLLCGILSVRQMEKIFTGYFSLANGSFFLIPVMFLNGLGIYIGRYLRFNTWDVVADPLHLYSDIGFLFFHPFRNWPNWGMIGCYSILLWMMYFTITKLRSTV
jgi:uncharacterized membrane protein